MRKCWSVAGMCLLLTLCLGGCTAGIDAFNNNASATLPPTQVTYRVPTGDTNQETTQSVLLYVPNAAGTRLIAEPVRVMVSAARHPAENTLRALFAYDGSQEAQALTAETRLQLSSVNPVEITGDVATVNLGTSALALTHSELYVAFQAIANTLAQWGDIRYVNVLVSSIQPGLDVGASVPSGCFEPNANPSIDALKAAAATQVSGDRRMSLTAALYFPSGAGKGILAEARTLTFAGRDKGEMIAALLAAMTEGANTLPNAASMPNLDAYLSDAPLVQEIAVAGGQRAVLHFRKEFNDALIDRGVPRSVMMAALTYTITSFVPGVSGVSVYIGEELVTAVVPSGVYVRAGEAVAFEDGLMRRGDFAHFLLSNCSLYFGDGAGHLHRVERPIPYYETRSARYLLSCLMAGPQSYDSSGGTQPILPMELSDADLLGVGLDDGVMLLNWSQHLAEGVQGYSEAEERLLIYAVVNTLCELPTVNAVSFFVNGVQPEQLAGYLYLPGLFMRNGSLVRE